MEGEGQVGREEKRSKKKTYWCGVPEVDGSVKEGGTVTAQERTLAGVKPMLVGGVHWGHWIQEGVRALGMGDTVERVQAKAPIMPACREVTREKEKARPEVRFEEKGHSRKWSGQEWTVSKEVRGGDLASDGPMGIFPRAISREQVRPPRREAIRVWLGKKAERDALERDAESRKLFFFHGSYFCNWKIQSHSSQFKTHKRRPDESFLPAILPTPSPRPPGPLPKGRKHKLKGGILKFCKNTKTKFQNFEAVREGCLAEQVTEQRNARAGDPGVSGSDGKLVSDKNTCFIEWNKIKSSSCCQTPRLLGPDGGLNSGDLVLPHSWKQGPGL